MKLKNLVSSSAALTFYVYLVCSPWAFAQDAPKSDMEIRTELIKAQTEQLKAELEYKKAQDALRNHDVDVAPPATEPKLSSGVSKGDIDVKIPATIQAHRAAIANIRKIVDDRLSKTIPAETLSLLVSSGTDPFNSTGLGLLLKNLVDQLDQLNSDVSSFLGSESPALLPHIAAVTSGVRNTVANLGSLFELFKVKTTFTNVDTSVSDEVYVAALGEALQAKHSKLNVVLLTPNLIPPPGPNVFEDVTALGKALKEGAQLAAKLKEKLQDISSKIAKIKNEIAEEEKKKPIDQELIKNARVKLDKLEKKLALGTGLQAQHDLSLTVTNQFYKDYFLTSTDGKPATGFLALRQAQLIKTHESSKGYYLRICPGPNGGINRTIEGLFNSGTLSHAGGAVVTYFLYDDSRKLVSSGSFLGMTPFRRMGDGSGDMSELKDDELIESNEENKDE